MSLKIKRSCLRTSIGLLEFSEKMKTSDDLVHNSELSLVVEHCASSAKFRRWCYYEWFYSAVDRLYFAQNEFLDCLANMNLSHVTSLKRKQWRHIRSKMGHPRRVSRSFLSQERRKVEQYRTEVRLAQIEQQQAFQKDQTQGSLLMSHWTPQMLAVKQHVVVVHPASHELESGYITTVIPSVNGSTVNYRVSFDNPLLSPADIVPDTHIMPLPPLRTSASVPGIERCMPELIPGCGTPAKSSRGTTFSTNFSIMFCVDREKFATRSRGTPWRFRVNIRPERCFCFLVC